MNTATDTLTIAKQLQRLKFSTEQAEGLAEVMHALEEKGRGKLVTQDHLDARLSKLENKLIVWMVGSQVATIGLMLGMFNFFLS